MVIIFFLIIFLIYILKSATYKNMGTPLSNNRKIPIVATFYPLAEFARQIGGDKVEVINITPPGIEPHDFEPTPQDIVRIRNSQLFIYNGIGFEAWVERILPDLEGLQTITIDSSRGVDIQTTSDTVQNNSDINDRTVIYDPHIWLNPALAGQQVQNIVTGLIQADPDNTAYYEQNAQSYMRNLTLLDEAFKEGLMDCQNRNVVTSHNVLGYLSQRYNLNIISIAGLSPEEEPSPKRLAEIADFARIHNVKYIFFETLVRPLLSQTIASEVGAQTLVFNPLEGLTEEEIMHGENYISIQQQNLENLKTALNCK